jgi:hypothetical protein
MIIGYLLSAFHSRFISVIKAFFNIRFSNQLAREEFSLTHPVSVFLSINFLVTSSLFILQLIYSDLFINWVSEFNFLNFLIVIIIIFLVYLIKIISIKLLGFIFRKSIISSEYIFITFLSNQIIGIGLIPVIIFIAYSKQSFENGFIYTGIVLLIVAFIMRIVKGTITALVSREVSPFYLLLYLCTFEILPLLLGFKLIEKLL